MPLPDGTALQAAVARPGTGADPRPDRGRPGLIVLHEIFGLNDDMRRICGHLADHGYVALAPDLYSHGNKALCLSRVLLAGAVGSAQRAVLDDVEATRAALAAFPDVDDDRIGIIGFCAGGGFALGFASSRPGVRVASVNYGAVAADRDALARSCPVVGSFGGDDRLFAGQGRRLERHLTELGIPHDVKVYEGVGHSFLSYDNGPAWLAKLPSPLHAGYDDEAATDAWSRIFAFLDEHLGPPGRPSH